MEIGLKNRAWSFGNISKRYADEEDNKSLKFDLVTDNISKPKLRMEQVSDLNARLFETHVYYVVNCNSLAEVRAKAEEEYKGDEEKLELFESLYGREERFMKKLFFV